MNKSRGRSQVVFANGKLFAIRQVHDHTASASATAISKDKRTVPLPELGGIAYRFETFNRELAAVRLGKIRAIQGTLPSRNLAHNQRRAASPGGNMARGNGSEWPR